MFEDSAPELIESIDRSQLPAAFRGPSRRRWDAEAVGRVYKSFPGVEEAVTDVEEQYEQSRRTMYLTGADAATPVPTKTDQLANLTNPFIR